MELRLLKIGGEFLEVPLTKIIIIRQGHKTIRMKRTVLFFPLFLFCFSAYSNNWKTIQLTDRQLEKFESFSNTYGFIRYFYPRKELQKLDWDRFLMYGVEEIIENDDENVIQLLHRLFSPICPEIVFSKNEIISTEIKIQAPFYIQEHHFVGEFASLFYGKNYTPIKLIEEEDYLQFYHYKLQNDLYVKFPIAVKELLSKTSEYRALERELKKIEFEGTKWRHLISKRSRANSNFVVFQYTFRIADIINRWQIIHNFYSYYEEDNLSFMWGEHCKEAIRNVALCENWQEFYDIIRKLFSNIRDSHVTVWTNFTLGSFGMYISSYYPEMGIDFAGNVCYISDVGAYSEKLQRGDVIEMVDTIPIDEFITKRLKYSFYTTIANSLKSLAGDYNLFESYERDKVFTLQIKKTDGSATEVTIKANITDPYYVKPTNDFIHKFDDSIIYINLCSSSTTYENFSSRIADYQQSKGVIFDTRGFPNYDALSIISHFIKDTVSIGNLLRPVISFPNREKIRYVETEKWKIAPAVSDLSKEFSKKYEYKEPLPIAIDVPIVFLTDAKAMSFAETFLDIVSHYKIGTIIGEPTAGCNGDMTRIRRPFGTYSFTYNKFKNRDKSSFHCVGIQPDIISVSNFSDILLGIDTQLERAKTYLHKIGN